MQKISQQIKKNLLDLQYNKYLQYQNTTIILTCTYFIELQAHLKKIPKLIQTLQL